MLHGHQPKELGVRHMRVAAAVGCPDSLDSTDTTPGNTCHIYRQSSLIFIDEERDGVLDSNSGSEAHSYLKSVGVKHLLYVGVASNMCVMHREDATLNMVSWGWDVAVVRDEVDAMYSPQDSPYVSHEVANEIQASYFEQLEVLTQAKLNYKQKMFSIGAGICFQDVQYFYTEVVLGRINTAKGLFSEVTVWTVNEAVFLVHNSIELCQP